MNRLATVACAAMAMAGCAEPVSVEPVGDYTSWKRLDVRGPAPGHGSTYRIIYANDVAADPMQDFVGGYANGAVIVKEIRDDLDGAPGDLRYLAIMRRDDALTDEGGWLFTQADDAESAESHPSYCWARCHAAAPYAGAWYDYRR